MQDIKKTANRLISVLALVSMVFGLGALALPKPVKAAGEDFFVGFFYEASYSVEGQNQEIRIEVEDRQLGGIRGDIEVGYEITPGMNPSSYASSTSADDFIFNGSTATSGVITIPANTSSVFLSVQDIDDANIENREAFTITLTGVVTTGTSTVALSRAYPSHFHVIEDNDSAVVSIARAPEGNTSGAEGSGPGSFKVLLSKVSPVDVTFDWAVSDDTATYPEDFSVLGGRATILAGQTSTTLSIGIVDDNIQESGEQRVLIQIFNPVNAVLGAQQSIVYFIGDNDNIKLGFEMANASGLENVGTVPVKVVLNYPSTNQVSADVVVQNAIGYATTPEDFVLQNSHIVIPAGATSSVVDVVINDDSLQEPVEYVGLILENVNGGSEIIQVGPNTIFTYSIQDNGDVNNTPTLNLSGFSASGSESERGAVVVSMDTVSASDVTFQWKIDGGTASLSPVTVGTVVFPADFSGGSASYATGTIPAGSLTTTIYLDVTNDNLSEQDETIELSITNAVGALIGLVNSQIYTIFDNDLPTVQFRSAASSGAESTVNPSFVLELSNPSQIQVNVYFANSLSSTATYNTDWSLHGLVASILPGQTIGEMILDVVDDATQESNEDAVFNIDYADGALVGANRNYTYTIAENDAPVISGGGSGGGGSSSGGSSSGGGSGIAVIPAVLSGSGVFAGENQSVKVDSVTTVGDMNFANLIISGGTAVRMAISNNANFENAIAESYKTSAMWKLTSGTGVKTVYVKFFNNAGFASEPVSTTVAVGSAEGQVLGVQISLVDELVAKLKFGSTSDEVKQLQAELQRLGFFPAKAKITRYYGLVTKAAVQKYIDNKFSTMSVDELVAVLKYGQRGLAVKRLQDELKKFGVFPATITSSGLYGPATKAAVAKYLASK